MCLNRRCVDPCPGACGFNAVCNAVAHEPRCDCLPSHTGNPLIECRPIENIRKIDLTGRLLFILLSKIMMLLINHNLGNLHRDHLMFSLLKLRHGF